MHDSSPPNPPHPLISVIIPTFERPELLLQRGLASALAQSYPNLEVLVVMDGPDPETAAALAAIDDPRLRPLTLPQNSGPADARNYGVQHARGEWVAFLDDDDTWRPHKLARQLELAQASAYPLPVVLCGYIIRTPYGDRLHPARPKRPGEPLGDYMLARSTARQIPCPVFGILVLAPRQLALRLPWTPGLRTSEDWDWMLRLEELEGVGFEQLSPQESSTLAIYYSGEDRPSGSRNPPWRPAFEWARQTWQAGRLSGRAFTGYLLTQTVPLAVRAGDFRAAPMLARALLATRPTPYEIARFTQQWVIPAPLRARVRLWLNTRRAPVRLGSDAPEAAAPSGQE